MFILRLKSKNTFFFYEIFEIKLRSYVYQKVHLKILISKAEKKFSFSEIDLKNLCIFMYRYQIF